MFHFFLAKSSAITAISGNTTYYITFASTSTGKNLSTVDYYSSVIYIGHYYFLHVAVRLTFYKVLVRICLLSFYW